jgi:lipid-binding SYLF domain-containing protein
MKSLSGFAMALVLSLLAGCGNSPRPLADDERVRLDTEVMATVSEFQAADPGLDRFFRNAYAYAVFPNVQAGAVVVGGSHGHGEVFQGGKLVGYADVSKASVGAQVGGQSYAQIVFFENPGTYAEFTGGTFELDAKASAVAASAGASTSANYEKGVLVVTRAKGGLMVQAAVGGQKFRFTPFVP